MAIKGHKERALLRRGYHIQEALQRRSLNEHANKRRSLLIKEEEGKKEVPEKVGVEFDPINLDYHKAEVFCNSAKRDVEKLVYCKISGIAKTIKSRDKLKKFFDSVNNIYDFIRGGLKIGGGEREGGLKVDNRRTFLSISKSCLEHSNPVKAFELISNWMLEPKEITDDGEIIKLEYKDVIKKLSNYVKKTRDTDKSDEELEEFLRKIRAIEYKLYEKSFVGTNFSFKGGWIELEHGHDEKRFLDVIEKVVNGTYDINDVIKKIADSIGNMSKESFMDKADLQINDGITLKSNGVDVLKSGDKVEIKKMDYTSDSYFSEFFSLYKNPKNLPDYAKTPEFVQIYAQIVNGVYGLVKNRTDILNHIKSGLSGVMFDNNIFIKMENIKLYWSNQGARDCEKEPRLTIRYQIIPDKDRKLIIYKYNHTTELTQEVKENVKTPMERKCQ